MNRVHNAPARKDGASGKAQFIGSILGDPGGAYCRRPEALLSGGRRANAPEEQVCGV
ncbi:hypothetical protein GCM10019059_19750 [Camelimonas fluminis]|nr:hypothetical protein GCM10019059_19750 [Camelimonas fluminis]